MTLAEVLVAVAILTIGLLSVVGMISSGFSGVVVSGGQSKATSYARQKLEELKNRCYNNPATGCADATFPVSNGNDTPEVFTDGRHLAYFNERLFNSDFASFQGSLCSMYWLTRRTKFQVMPTALPISQASRAAAARGAVS